MNEPNRTAWYAKAGAGGVAGFVAGLLWGWISSDPHFSYFSAIPGDLVEDLYENLIRSVGGVVHPPGRVAVFVLIHGLVGASVAFVISALLLALGVTVNPATAGLTLAATAAAFVSLVWSRRGITLEPPTLATVALLVGSLCAGVVWLYGRAGAWRCRAGAAVVALLVGGLAWSSWPPSLSRVSSDVPGARSRLLIIGVDAASWANLEPAIRRGELPHLAALRDRGAAGDLQSLRVTLSPVIWTTLVTGKEPGEHGIVDFARNGVPYSSNSRRAFALWEILERFGRRGAFHYWWASWPAEEVAGRIVTDRFLDRALDQRVWPDSDEAVLDRIADTAIEGASSVLDLTEPIAAVPDAGFLERHREKIQVLDEILRRDAVATALGVEALGGDFDVVATYLRGPDAAGHKFWKWHWQVEAPRRAALLFGPPDEDQLALGGVVKRVNEIIDRQVGELVAMTDSSWHILLISDHGMTGSVTLDAQPGAEAETGGHHRSGLILLAGPSIRAGGRIRGASVYDALPTALYLIGLPIPADMSGRVLAEAIREPVLRSQPVLRTDLLGERVAGDPRPIPTGEDDAYLDQLRALGYVIDGPTPTEGE